MSDLSTRLNLPFIKPSQAQKHVTHNEALLVLDGLVQSVLEGTGAETPPADPVDGTLYALGTNPTGDWDGQGGTLALRSEGAWRFIAPQTGWRAWDKTTEAFMVFTSNTWTPVVPGHDNLPGVGVGTTSDSTNKLAVASDASLFSHDGDGHQMKVNKASGGDTASLLFQSGWTGHAEMGLAGDTDFSIKVSDDGTNWQSALKALAENGNVAIGGEPTSDSKLRVVIDQGGIWNTAFERYNNGGGSHNFLFRKARGSAASPAAVQAGDALTSITSSGYDGTGFATVGVIRFNTESVTGSDISGKMDIQLSDTSGDLQTHVTINEDGHVGIGSSSPSTKLDVDGPVRVKSYTVAGAPPASVGAGAIIFVSNESGGAVLAFSDGTDWRRVTDRAVIS